MKANFKVANGKMTFEVVGEQAKDIWAQVAQIQELFEAEAACGLCGGTDLRYGHRVTAGSQYHYYELVCRKCHGVFQFGQMRASGEIFPKRKDKNKVALPNGGWRKWEDRGVDPDEGEYEPEPPAIPQQRQPAPQQAAPGRQQQPPPRPPAPPQQQQRQAPPAGQGQSARDLAYERDHDGPPIGEPPPARRGRGGDEW
jgi:hypothetical protein